MEEKVKEWKRELKHEERNIERTITGVKTKKKKPPLFLKNGILRKNNDYISSLFVIGIDREEAKIVKDIKERIKKGDKGSAKILAKELVRSRKAKERLYQSKAELNSVSMQLTQNMGISFFYFFISYFLFLFQFIFIFNF
jgi:hypothetical protein